MTPDQVLLTTAEVANRCRVGQESVRRWVRDGDLEAVTLPSGTLRFHAEVIDAFLARPVRPSAPADAEAAS
jgi:excisionase family DNA binding protein